MDRIERNVRSYMEGRASGIPEGMARVLADLVQGRTLAEVLAECQRTTPRVWEELQQRGVAPLEGGGLRVVTAATTALVDRLALDVMRLRDEPRLTVADVEGPAANDAAPESTPAEAKASAAEVVAGAQPVPRRTELHGDSQAGAVFSGGGAYRYLVWRVWGENRLGNVLAFVKHNPSKASADRSDPTFERAVGFARRLGFSGVVMANVAAIVATDPGELRDLTCKQLAGPANGRALKLVLRHARMVVVGWGNPSTPNVQALARRFVELARAAKRELYCLGTNGGGKHPRHLLARGQSRIPDDAKLELWTP